MGIDLCEVELSGDQEEDRSQGGEPAVAAGLSLGGLEESVEGLDEAVGLAGSRPGDDALQMRPDHFGDGLHGFDLGAVHIDAPLPEHPAHDVDLLSLEDFPELLSMEPGAGGSLARRLGDQGVEVGALFGGEALPAFQQGPADVLLN